jgi:hypothetical protein
LSLFLYQLRVGISSAHASSVSTLGGVTRTRFERRGRFA